MHIPDIEKAIAELSRVLRKGGMIIISEANMFSLQSVIMNSLKMFRGMKMTKAGLEYWAATPDGKYLVREVNVGWLKEKFERRGFKVKKRISGQFTELYTRFSRRMPKRLIHAFNYFLV